LLFFFGSLPHLNFEEWVKHPPNNAPPGLFPYGDFGWFSALPSPCYSSASCKQAI
jgi:hypothetical protein